jgi:hypothetical protein
MLNNNVPVIPSWITLDSTLKVLIGQAPLNDQGLIP